MSRVFTFVIVFVCACNAYSQDETSKDPVELILIAQDLSDATRLMIVYDLDDDQFVDQGEMKKLAWRDTFKEFDFNKDGKLSHLEFAVRQAKVREDAGITALDVNSAKGTLRRSDKNNNGQLDPDEIESGWPNGAPDDYDRNNDSVVTLGELTHHFAFARGLRRETGIEGVDHSGAGSILRRFDANRDGNLDQDEAAKTYLPNKLTEFDENADDMLTIVELETMLSKHRRELGLTRTDQQTVNKLFFELDRDADGRIAENEMELPFQGSAGGSLPEYDSNKDGVVTRREVEVIIAGQRKEKGYIEEDYSKAFAMFRRHDTNRSKSLEIPELFSSPETGQLPRRLMDQADTNKDRKISMEELARHYAIQRQ